LTEAAIPTIHGIPIPRLAFMCVSLYVPPAWKIVKPLVGISRFLRHHTSGRPVSSNNSFAGRTADVTPVDSRQSKKEGVATDLLATPTVQHVRTGESISVVWIFSLLPLVLHFLCVVSIAVFVLAYVNNRWFHVDNRRPPVPQPDGSSVPGPYTLLQTDVLTIISAGIVASRFCAGMWVGATVWRSIHILLESDGLSLKQIEAMLQRQLLLRWSRTSTPPSKHKFSYLVVAFILAISLPSQLSGPILTGSVSWSSSFEHFTSQVAARIAVSHEASGWDQWRKSPRNPQFIYSSHLFTVKETHATTQSRTILDLSRRHIPNLDVPELSILGLVKLPYFKIKKIEWAADPKNEVDPSVLARLAILNTTLNPWARLDSGGWSGLYGLIPDAWDSLA
jgi:hypothetical protein